MSGLPSIPPEPPSAAVAQPKSRASRFLKAWLLAAGILLLLGAGSCAYAVTAPGYDALGPGLLGIFLLGLGGLVAIVGLVVAAFMSAFDKGGSA